MALENFRAEWDLNSVPRDTGAMLLHAVDQTDLEVVVNCVHDNLLKMKVDVQYMRKSFIL